MKILITGGAGFIGSAVTRHLIKNTSHSVINVDKLTYAGNLDSLSSVALNSWYEFTMVDTSEASSMLEIFCPAYELILCSAFKSVNLTL